MRTSLWTGFAINCQTKFKEVTGADQGIWGGVKLKVANVRKQGHFGGPVPTLMAMEASLFQC